MSSTNETKKPSGAAEPTAEAQSAPADTAPKAEQAAETAAPQADKTETKAEPKAEKERRTGSARRTGNWKRPRPSWKQRKPRTKS